MITKTTPAAAAALLAATAILLSGCSLGVRDDRAEQRADGGASAPVERESDDASSGSESGPTTGAGAVSSGDCAGRDLEIDAPDDTVVMTGECGDVRITGAGATVTLDAAAGIEVQADGVTLVLTGDAASFALAGDGGAVTLAGVGSIAIDGTENVVTAVRADEVVIAGTVNTVTWTEGTSDYVDAGAMNIVLAP
jgi:hypothetical protein